jgi:hypothetical protein
MRRVLCDAIIARLARFLIELTTTDFMPSNRLTVDKHSIRPRVVLSSSVFPENLCKQMHIDYQSLFRRAAFRQGNPAQAIETTTLLRP